MPDGTLVVAGDSRGRVRLWSLEPTPRLRTAALLDGPVHCVEAQQDAVIAGSAGGSLYCLDLAGHWSRSGPAL